MKSTSPPSIEAKPARKIHALLIGMLIGTLIFSITAVLVIAYMVLRPRLALSQTATPITNLVPFQTSTTAPLVPTYTTTSLPTSTVTPSITPTSTNTLTPSPFIYTVQAGDTLYSIAIQFNTTISVLVAVNNLTSNMILVGQQLLIDWTLPGAISGTPSSPVSSTSGGIYTVSSTDTIASIAGAFSLEPSMLRAANYMSGDGLLPRQQLRIPPAGQNPVTSSYHFSLLEGDLASAYPLTWETSRYTLHYSPNTFVAIDPLAVSDLVTNALDNDESVFQIPLSDHFDVYVAGSIYEPPSRALRGRSFSYELRYHFLHDGSGNASDQQYIAAHELTHLYTWNTFGMPASTMLSEGAAVYAGMQMIAGSAHLPLQTFCAAYLQADALPYISSSLSYNGHNIDLENYYAAGCFVSYLIQAYSPASFALVYHSGNYDGVYGKSLYSLEADWRFYTSTWPIPNWLDSFALLAQVEAVTSAYETFFPFFTGTPTQLEAYYYLDQARLALLEARLADSATLLQSYNAVLNQP